MGSEAGQLGSGEGEGKAKDTDVTSVVVWPHRASPLRQAVQASAVRAAAASVVVEADDEEGGGGDLATAVSVQEQAQLRIVLTEEAEEAGEGAKMPTVTATAPAKLVREVVTIHAKSPAAARPTPTKTLRVIMAGGGTGGHLYPGLAVAEALEDLAAERGAAVELIWAATPRPVDQRLLGRFGGRYVKQPVQPLSLRPLKMWSFWNGWEKSCQYWKKEFRTKRIDGVLALGGYAAGPAAYVARKFGVPIGLLNPDALPGLANRFLLKRADVVFAQWELPEGMTKKIAGEVRSLGCPIRGALVGRSRAEGAAALGLDPARPVLVITGGSLAAKNINEAMAVLLKDPEFTGLMRARRWQVIHLAGAEFLSAARAAYQPVDGVPAKVLDYCDDMASVWAVADVAIARAGASTCAELAACGVPAVLLPYPYHRDLHQKHNAEHLVKAGAAVIVDDVKDAKGNAAGVQAVLASLLSDEQKRAAMAAAARAAGKPTASRDIAAALMKLMTE